MPPRGRVFRPERSDSCASTAATSVRAASTTRASTGERRAPNATERVTSPTTSTASTSRSAGSRTSNTNCARASSRARMCSSATRFRCAEERHADEQYTALRPRVSPRAGNFPPHTAHLTRSETATRTSHTDELDSTNINARTLKTVRQHPRCSARFFTPWVIVQEVCRFIKTGQESVRDQPVAKAATGTQRSR